MGGLVVVDPTLTISIDRTSLSLSPLLASGREDGTTLGVTSFTEPAKMPRVTYAPSSAYSHGETPLAWAYQQALLRFEIVASVSDEAGSKAQLAALEAACAQWPTFTVTVTVGNAAPRVYSCHPGSVEPAGERTLVDLRDVNPAWIVALPCHPIPA